MLPFSTYAAGGFVPCNGPECQACNVVQLVQNIITWMLTLALPSIFAVLVAVAGFKMVTSGGNEGKVSEARHIFSNIVVGLVIILAAWVIVDTILKTFLRENVIGEGTQYGPWNQIKCTQQPAMNQSVEGVVIANGSGGVSSYVLSQCGSGNTACSTSVLQATGLTAQQANVMSCIAVTESAGIAATPPYNTTHPGSNSSACGTFQIVKTTWKTVATGACTDFATNCQNATCNAQVAATLVKNHGYTDWTCVGCNNKAAACVQKYSGG